MMPLRVVSLLPAATEIVAALGARDRLVGISHECDYPPSVSALPRVTSTPIDAGAASGDIDRRVRALWEAGNPVIAVNAEELRRLAPDLVLTQGLCEVCAVSDGVVHRLAEALNPAPRVLSLAAHDLPGIFADILNVADTLDLRPEGDELVAGLRYRLDRLTRSAPARRPRVIVVEWLDPVYLAGHWVPELVVAAGGIDVGAAPGAASRRIETAALATLAPEVVLVALCGFSAERARAELERTPLPQLAAPVWVLDGNAFTSRAGPRVVDGAALMQAAMNDEVRPGVVKVATLGSEIGVRPP